MTAHCSVTFNRWYANLHREYYAIRLYESVDGPGTHESALIRIILDHSETDMKELEDQFRIYYTRELRSKIGVNWPNTNSHTRLNDFLTTGFIFFQHDTSGDFERLLLAFLPRTPAEEAEKRKKREERRKKQKERKEVRANLGLPYHAEIMMPGMYDTNVENVSVNGQGIPVSRNTMMNPNMVVANPAIMSNPNVMADQATMPNPKMMMANPNMVPHPAMTQYQTFPWTLFILFASRSNDNYEINRYKNHIHCSSFVAFWKSCE